jgi:cytochrome P450
MAAFRSSLLQPVGPRGTLDGKSNDDHLRQKMRSDTTEILSSAAIEKWREETAQIASALLCDATADHETDLVRHYARPLCQYVAILISNPSGSDSELLTRLAAHISAAAAAPFDLTLSSKAKECETELQKHFSSGPVPLRESGFVALSQTLVCLLARCWLALLENPAEWGRLHDEPERVGDAVNELLRYAGLTEILFRMAAADVDVNGVRIRKGERVVLRITAANRDPARFADPDYLNTSAKSNGQLALGFGKHSCVGAPLIRMVVSTATRVLVQRFRTGAIVGKIEWQGGAGFCFPSALNVLLHEGNKSS